MIEKIFQNKFLFISIFIIIGYLGTFPFFPKIFGVLSVVIPVVIIFASKNKGEEALLFSCYMVGSEVFIRMIGGFYLYETSKYAIILFLLIGIFFGEFKQRFSLNFIFYLMLLMLGIIFTKVPEGESLRKEIIFNLSGPIVLGVAGFYFNGRPISSKKIIDSLFLMLLPIFSIVTFLYFRTPDLAEIIFRGSANFETSGGFGPNQVATVIGIGIFIITIFLILKQKLTGFILLDYLFLVYFIFRGLLTFSRGGIISSIIAIIAFAILYLIYKKISFGIFFKYTLTILFFSVSVWLYTSNLTGGMLENRYIGVSIRGVEKDITAGRAKIFMAQFDNFLANPLGIGVGNGKYERKYSDNRITEASHNEVGRLLEEHGYIGLVLFLLLLFTPLFNFFRSNNYQRAFIISFYILWFLTINHSAMRIALPGFIYALSLIIITDMDE